MKLFSQMKGRKGVTFFKKTHSPESDDGESLDAHEVPPPRASPSALESTPSGKSGRKEMTPLPENRELSDQEIPVAEGDPEVWGMVKAFEGTEHSGRVIGVTLSGKFEFQTKDQGESPKEFLGPPKSAPTPPTGSLVGAEVDDARAMSDLGRRTAPADQEHLTDNQVQHQQSVHTHKHSFQTEVGSIGGGEEPSEPDLDLDQASAACDAADPIEQLQGLKSLRAISRCDKTQRLGIVESGGIPRLTNFLTSGKENAELVQEALLTLINLSIDDESMDAMAPIVPLAAPLLSHPAEGAREAAAGLVFSFSRHSAVRKHLFDLAVVAPLVGILRDGTIQGKRDACKSLFNLSYLPDSTGEFLSCRVTETLGALLAPPSGPMAEKATCLLANLARVPEGCHAVMESEELLLGLLEVLDSGTPLGKEQAASTLLLLARCEERYREAIFLESPFMALNYLESTGSKRAREKADALLKVLRKEET